MVGWPFFVCIQVVLQEIRVSKVNATSDRCRNAEKKLALKRKDSRSQFHTFTDDRISHTTVRRILLNKGEKKSRKQYAPTSVPKELHPTVKLLVDSLYEEENTRTTEEIVQIIKEKKYRAIGSRGVIFVIE